MTAIDPWELAEWDAVEILLELAGELESARAWPQHPPFSFRPSA